MWTLTSLWALTCPPARAQEMAISHRASSNCVQNTNLYFAKQVIQNACGTQALLNIMMNAEGIQLGDELSGFKGPFPPPLLRIVLVHSPLVCPPAPLLHPPCPSSLLPLMMMMTVLLPNDIHLIQTCSKTAFTSDFPADLKGEAMSNSELIRTSHNSFARSIPPPPTIST